MKIPAFAAFSMLTLGGCGAPLCDSRVVQDQRSPDGRHRFVLFMRECRATTDFTTQLSIDPWFFEITGNTFIADAYNGGRRGAWGGPWVAVMWSGPNELLVSHDPEARVFDQKTDMRGVRINYVSIRNGEKSQ